MSRAKQLRSDARQLARRFNRDFWMADRGFYALALERGGRRVAVIASNAGQALWTGIVTPSRRRRVAERLMAEDMYSGWGIRTLSAGERAYNPVGYHLGTVWPHDNALIAAGFQRCGFGEWADRIFEDLLRAASCFEHFRLPEVFSGISRSECELPVRYPIACHPQAWAAGTLPYLLQALLGLEPDAFAKRLALVRPRLPASIPDVHLAGLRVGTASVDLQFTRRADGTAHVEVERVTGELAVSVSQ
jgi:glycogen debranching enzyme